MTPLTYGPRNKMRNIPIVAMILIGSSALVWMAWELASLNWKYGHAWNHAGTQTAILIMLALSLLCLGLAWLFWRFPWIESAVTLDTDNLTLRSTGLISFPDAHIKWNDIETIHYIGGLYRNNLLDIQYRSDQYGTLENRRIATRAVGVTAKVLMQAIDKHVHAAGFALDGPPVDGLLILTAKWQLVKKLE